MGQGISAVEKALVASGYEEDRRVLISELDFLMERMGAFLTYGSKEAIATTRPTVMEEAD